MTKKELIFWAVWFIIFCPILLWIYFKYRTPEPIIYTDGFQSAFDDRPNNEIREIDKNY